MPVVHKRSCRDCGSPAEGNPCWYFLRREYDSSDPPCYGRLYDREQNDIARGKVRDSIRILCALSVLAVAAYFGIQHATKKPTLSQLFGCSVANTDPATGECR